MRDALRKLKPDRFEDIIAIVALYRPGPMDNIDSYVNRKHGREQPDYLHPLIQPILEETYGVIIYQEQVMQIAQTLSGFSLGEADLLRRAMGKKIKKEMAQQRNRFIEGAVGKGVDRGSAEFIFELVAKFAGYGFNKSHAAAYALIAYQTAYLKANHPIEFLAASMTLDIGNTDKLNGFAQEARRMGIRIEPPSVNRSEAGFMPSDGAIRYSLAALRNVGRHAVDHICAEREKRGLFKDVSEFARAINPRLVNKRALEMLAAAGAFDELGIDRATALANVDRIMAAGNRSLADETGGQNDLFAGAARTPPPIELRAAKPWVPTDRLSHEFEAVGFFLTGHPLDDYQEVLEALGAEILGGLRGEGAHTARRRHARRNCARDARAPGQERQRLRLRRLLRSDRPVRGGGVLGSLGRLARAAPAGQRRAARRRGRSRRRDRQGAGPAHHFARCGRRGAP